MSQFIELLGKIAVAKNKKQRKIAVAEAIAEIPQVTGDEDWRYYTVYGAWVGGLNGLIKSGKHRAQKHLETLIKVIADKNKIFSEDSLDDLLLQIKRCKSIEELNALEILSLPYEFKYKDTHGKKFVFNLTISLEDRIQHLVQKHNENYLVDDLDIPLRNALVEQKKYLTSKRTADKWAWPMTIVLCMLGIGVVCGIAMFVAIPAFIGVIGLIAASGGMGYLAFPPFYTLLKRALSDNNKKWAAPITATFSVLVVGLVFGLAMTVAWPIIGVVGFVATSAVIGYVEIPVFYKFIERSLRNIFARGVFQAIDNNLLNGLAREEGLQDRHEFDDAEKIEKLNDGATWWWRRLKYALTSVGGVLTLISTVGFSALAYTQMLELLPLLGLTAGFGMVAIPVFFALISLPYFFVMFDNIFRAIKNNIIGQIWEQVKAVYFMDGFVKASLLAQFTHLAKCLGKSILVAVVLGIVVFATVFSAGAWLQGSVNFFSGTLGVASAIAEKIGMVVGSVQLATNFGFNLENCFKTIASISKVIENSNDGVRLYFRHLAERVHAEPFVPNKIGIAAWGVLRVAIKYVPLLLHVLGVGMLSAQGVEAFILKPFLGGNETACIAIAVATQGSCELLEDSHTLMHDHSHAETHAHHGDHHDEHHHHHHHHEVNEQKSKCDGHEHADPAADTEVMTDGYISVCDKAITFFSNIGKPAPAPKLLPEHVSVSIKP